MKRLRVSSLAERDLDDIWYRIALNSGIALADQVIDSITEKFALLAEFPEAGVRRDEIDPGVRALPVQRYLIYYRESGKFLDIARVLHGMRDQCAAFSEAG